MEGGLRASHVKARDSLLGCSPMEGQRRNQKTAGKGEKTGGGPQRGWKERQGAEPVQAAAGGGGRSTVVSLAHQGGTEVSQQSAEEESDRETARAH